MSDLEFWQTIYRALMMILKAIAKAKLGKTLIVECEPTQVETITPPFTMS